MENLQYYYKCMVNAAREHGFAAFAWDNNVFGNGTEKFGIFKRNSNMAVGNEYALKGICEGAGTEYVEPEHHEGGETVVAGDLFWDGDAVMDWGDGLQLTIPGSDIKNYGKDIMIYLVYTLDYTDYNMIQFFYGDWKSNPSFFVNGSEINKEFESFILCERIRNQQRIYSQRHLREDEWRSLRVLHHAQRGCL